jgi:hypothetical protein
MRRRVVVQERSEGRSKGGSEKVLCLGAESLDGRCDEGVHGISADARFAGRNFSFASLQSITGETVEGVNSRIA